MIEQALLQTLLLLGVTVFVVLLCQRLRVPSSLAYLLVGVVLGSHTAGPVINDQYIRIIAEFGIVFLLFSIGLSFSLSQIYAMRHTILGLGTAQVALTTALVGMGAWLLGMPAAMAFVAGAVFAQSSTTVISKQLLEQGEDNTRHGRLGTAMSVFQDITAVPFVIIIPVLGTAVATAVAGELAWALLKAFIAMLAVLLVGRYLLKPFFHLVAESRSPELFTLTVLFVSLASAGVTALMGLSMAFGAFLAGMVLAETEFRHQVEATVRPFRDVLLGVFFVSIGMLVQPALLPEVWIEAVIGALLLLSSKLVLVFLIIRFSGIDSTTAWRTALILAVGGEFGFALIAIALDGAIIDPRLAQILLYSVLLSMIIAPFIIRNNLRLSAWLSRHEARQQDADESLRLSGSVQLGRHVVICGFGRTGQMVGRLLEREGVPFVALDTDSSLVREARLAGSPVYFADSTEAAVLDAAGVGQASLLVISHNDRTAAIMTLACVARLEHRIPVLVRARDESMADELRAKGAAEVIPETLEAGLTLASHALLTLGVPMYRVTDYLQEQRRQRYPMLRELFRGQLDEIKLSDTHSIERLHSIQIDDSCPLLGQALGELPLGNVLIAALVRDEQRTRYPAPQTRLQAGDVLVLLGATEDIRSVEVRLTGGATSL